MALNSGKILMRRGQEVNFDPNKMTPGEWAVSLDSKYVRMCFAPGVCVRMATYDAFEADMEQIRRILAECQTVEEAVTRINDEISVKEQAVAEYTAQAKQYRDEAEQFRNQAFSSTPEGYLELVEQVGENTRKIEEGVGGVSDYEDLDNKPKINEVELSGNKTLEELGVKPHALTIPTNNLLATEAGTALDAVQGKVLDEKITSVNVGRKNGTNYSTLADLVTATATDIGTPHLFRFKDTGGYILGRQNTWYRMLICYQNKYADGENNDVGGSGFIWGSKDVYKVVINGTKASGISLIIEKLVTETELNNKSDIIYRKQIDAGSSVTIKLEPNHSYQLIFTHPSTTSGQENSRGFYICSAYNFDNENDDIAITTIKEASNVSFSQSVLDLTITASNRATWCTIIDFGSRLEPIG